MSSPGLRARFPAHRQMRIMPAMTQPTPSRRDMLGAAAIGAAAILSTSTTIAAEAPPPVVPRARRPWKRSLEEIRKAVPVAEEMQVKIAIENVWNQFLLSPLEAARYVDEFNSPWVGWHFDIGNIINYGWPEQWIHILGKRIVKLHFKEFSKKKRDNEGLRHGFSVDLLEGENDWPAIMAALDATRYNTWACAEVGGGGPERMSVIARQLDQILAM